MKRTLILPLLTGLVLFASCGSDEGDSTPTSASAASTATSVVGATDSGPTTSTTLDSSVTLDSSATETAATETAATGDTATDTATATDDTTEATSATDATSASTSTTLTAATESTDVVQTLAAESISVVVGGSNPSRPTFEWTTVTASPLRYQLIVQAADGTPVWAWTGTDTQTVLGGVERPADVEGPTLTGPSRVRVYAVAEDGSFAGVSPWVPIDPTA